MRTPGIKLRSGKVSKWKLCHGWDAVWRQSRGFLVIINTLTKWHQQIKSGRTVITPGPCGWYELDVCRA